MSDLASIDLIDKPDIDVIEDTYRELEELGCITYSEGTRKLSKLGGVVCRMALEPRMGSMVYYSVKYNCTEEIMKIISVINTNLPIIYSYLHNSGKKKELYEAINIGNEKLETTHVVLPENNKLQETSIKIPKEKMFQEIKKRLSKLFNKEHYIFTPRLLLNGDLLFFLFVFNQFSNITCIPHTIFGGIKKENYFCPDCREAQFKWCNLFNLKFKALDVACKNYRDIHATYRRYCFSSKTDTTVSYIISKKYAEYELKIANYASIYTFLNSESPPMGKIEPLLESIYKEITENKPKNLQKELVLFYSKECYEAITKILLKVYGKQMCMSINIKKHCKRVIVELPNFKHRRPEAPDVIEKIKSRENDRKYLWATMFDIVYFNVVSGLNTRVSETSIFRYMHYWAVDESPYKRKAEKLGGKSHLSSVFPPAFILYMDQVAGCVRVIKNVHRVDESFIRCHPSTEIREYIGRTIDSLKQCMEYIFLGIGPSIMKEMLRTRDFDDLQNRVRYTSAIPYYQTNKIGVICSRSNASEMFNFIGRKISETIDNVEASSVSREAYWETGIYAEIGSGGQMMNVSVGGEVTKAIVKIDEETWSKSEIMSFLYDSKIKFMAAVKSNQLNGWLVFFSNKVQYDLFLKKKGHQFKQGNISLCPEILESVLEPQANFIVKIKLYPPYELEDFKEVVEKNYGKVHSLFEYYSEKDSCQVMNIRFSRNEDGKKLLDEVEQGHDIFKASDPKQVMNFVELRIPTEIINSQTIQPYLTMEIDKLNKFCGNMPICIGGSRRYIKIFSSPTEIVKDTIFLLQPETVTLCKFAYLQVAFCSQQSEIFGHSNYLDWCKVMGAEVTFVEAVNLVKIYGMPKQRLYCKYTLLKYISHVMQHSMIECVNLAKYPYHYSKTFYDHIRYTYPYTEVIYDSNFKQIMIQGYVSEVEKIVEFITVGLIEYKKDLELKSTPLKLIEYRKCVICLNNNIPREKYVLLGLCGHKFCKWCLKMQIASALRSHPNADLPLSCACCNERILPVNWESAGALRYYFKIMQAAMKHWKLLQGPEYKIEWCQNPNCKGIYDKTLLVPDTTTRYCRTCHKNLCILCGLDVIIFLN